MAWQDGLIMDASVDDRFIDKVRGHRPTVTGTIPRAIYSGRMSWDFSAASNNLAYPQKGYKAPPFSFTALMVPIVNAGDGSVGAIGGSFGAKGWTIRARTLDLRVTYSGVADYNVTSTFASLTAWCALTVSFNASGFTVWRDGVSKGFTSTGTMVSSTSTMQIGTNQGGNEFGGNIARVLYHNRELLGQDVRDMHRELLWGDQTNWLDLLGYAPSATFKAWLHYYSGIRNV